MRGADVRKVQNSDTLRNTRAIVSGVAIGGIAIAVILLVLSALGMPPAYGAIARLLTIGTALLLIVRLFVIRQDQPGA